MTQGMVLKDAARTDLSRSAFRMTSILSLSSSRSSELTESVKIQSTTELTDEEREMTGLGAFLVDQDYRQSVIGSVKDAALAPFNTAADLVEEIVDNVHRLHHQVHEALVAAPARRVNHALSSLWSRIVPQRKRKQQQEEIQDLGAVSVGHPPISFVDLFGMNVTFTDNYGLPLYDFRDNRNRYGFSKVVVNPLATENALESIRECSARAASLPNAEEGPYADIPLTQVLADVQEEDLQSFLNYVSAYPGNYIGRNLKISETFATWVIYGAPGPDD